MKKVKSGGCIVIENNKVLLEGNPLDIFKKNEYLKKNSIEIPEIIELLVP